MTDIQKDLTEWADAAFPGSDDQSKILHLFEELEEAFDETDDPKCREEIADAALIALHLASAHAVVVPVKNAGLETEMRRKLEICKKRNWGAADESGVVRHVE